VRKKFDITESVDTTYAMVDDGCLIDADDLVDIVNTNEPIMILVEDQQWTKICNAPIILYYSN
jgi:hypothetical protein